MSVKSGFGQILGGRSFRRSRTPRQNECLLQRPPFQRRRFTQLDSYLTVVLCFLTRFMKGTYARADEGVSLDYIATWETEALARLEALALGHEKARLMLESQLESHSQQQAYSTYLVDLMQKEERAANQVRAICDVGSRRIFDVLTYVLHLLRACGSCTSS